MEPVPVAQSSSLAGNATLVPASPPAAEPALSIAAGNGTLAPAANATSIPGMGVSEPMIAWWGYFEALGWLCFALALLWLFLWFLKRRGTLGFSGASVPDMRIEGRLALGPKKWVVITRYLDRRLILGVTEQQITLLSDMPVNEWEEREEPARQDKSFASLLKKEEQAPEG